MARVRPSERERLRAIFLFRHLFGYRRTIILKIGGSALTGNCVIAYNITGGEVCWGPSI
jgi:hypothetical protein